MGQQRTLRDLLPQPTMDDALRRLAQEGPPSQTTEPMPEWKRTAQEAFANIFDFVASALGATTETRAGQWGELLSAAVPLAGGLKAVKATKPIRAYHGSPHDFDQFSLSKIGTGEGAQAYGHGLYFAENPAVAADYRKSLARPTADAPKWRLDGEPVAVGTDRYRLAGILEQSGGPKDGEDVAAFVSRRVKELEDQASFADRAYGEDAGLMYRMQARELRAVDPSKLTMHQPGRTYEVDIHADPEDFLDWDAPLSQQPKGQAALDRIAPQLDPTSQELIRQDRQKLTGTGLLTYAKRSTGGDAVKASELLKEHGIPGIKYYDGASRGTTGGELIDTFQKDGKWFTKIRVKNRGGVGFQTPADVFTTSAPHPTREAAEQWAQSKIQQGTRNYVVFDDSLISIVKKYGIAGAISAGLINQAQARQLQEQGYQ